MSPDSTSGIVEQGSHPLQGTTWTLDVVRYQPTERPIEDRWSYAYDEPSSRLVVGVYDGHGGPACADHISTTLPHSLIAHPPSHHASMFANIDAQLTKSFTDDHSLLRLKSKSKDWKSHALIAKSGCMALICDVDLKTMTATISNAGDCRLAVIRRSSGPSTEQKANVVYETKDLNAKSPSEQARLEKEHPGEDMLIVSGRLFGRLMSTRGFGDVYYKLPYHSPLEKHMHKRYIDALSAADADSGKVPMNEQYASYFYGYRTPPYITPLPESSTVQVGGEDVIVLASDGLWDVVSTQEVADAVQAAIEAGEGNVAKGILRVALNKRPPGDDTTIVVVRRVLKAVDAIPMDDLRT